FLSAVMLKDYKKALKYCKLILQYEPDNSTAKEFYPLILDKLRGTNTSSDSDENYNKSSSSPEFILEAPSSDPSAGDSDEHDEQYLKHVREDRKAVYGGVDGGNANGIAVGLGARNDNNDPNSNVSSGSSADAEDDDEVEVDDEEGCASVDASLSDEDVEDDDVDDDCDDDDDDDEDDDEEEEDDDEDEDIMSSSGDDLPVDEQQILVGDVLDLDTSANACGVDAAINISNSSRNSSSGGKGSSRSDNTTHSYSSLLLEEEDDIVPANLHFPKDLHNTTDLDVSNGNKVPTSTSCSDSESPTEPLTQRLAAILRSKCGVSNTGA
ncbi:hypothetical protein DOY81_009211, partial [Sarcophaga bullata]